MTSAARSLTRAVTRSKPAFSCRLIARPAPVQSFRGSSRRGYASEAKSGKSSNGLLWGIALAAAGGAGAYFYLKGSEVKVKTPAPFVPTKEDYQKVYNEIAELLVEKDDYDDGSYGPVGVLGRDASASRP